MTMPTIVVGVDGEPASHSALRLALDEAAVRRCRVLLVACWSADAHHLPHRADGREGDSRRKAMMIAQQAVSSVAVDQAERSMIVTETAEGEPGPMLVRASHHALFLVIGSTTRGAVARHAGKTVVDHCLRWSDVPVIVVPYAPSGLDELDLAAELQRTSGDASADLPLTYDPFAWGS